MDNASNPIFNTKIGKQIASETSAEPQLRDLITKVLKQSPKDRQWVAVELSALTGERITERMLNDWLAPSKAKVRFPASFVRAFCEVLGDDRLARLTLPDNLRAALTIGEGISESDAKIEKLVASSKILRELRKR
jgi:hypothetical protein